MLAGILSILGPVQTAFADDASATTVWAAPGSQFQLLVGIITSGIFMKWVATRSPFKSPHTNRFKVWCDLCGTNMLVLSVMLKGSNATESLSPDSLGILLMIFAVYPFLQEFLQRMLLPGIIRLRCVHACVYICRDLIKCGCWNCRYFYWTCKISKYAGLREPEMHLPKTKQNKDHSGIWRCCRRHQGPPVTICRSHSGGGRPWRRSWFALRLEKSKTEQKRIL